MEKNSRTKVVRSSVVFAALAHLVVAGAPTPSLAAQGKLDTAKIEQLTGVKGELNEKEGVFTVRVPRTEVSAQSVVQCGNQCRCHSQPR